MELLKKCQDLYEELRLLADGMEHMDRKLKDASTDPAELEDLYKSEFKLAMGMAGAYQDLEAALTELEKNEDMKFYVTRVRTNARKILNVEVIELQGDY